MSDTITVDPSHLTDDDWVRVRAFLDAARARGEVVDLSSRVEMLSPAEVAMRLGMSRSTVRRRILNGDLQAVKVGTHHRIPRVEYERFSDELMLRMVQASASDIDAELFGE